MVSTRSSVSFLFAVLLLTVLPSCPAIRKSKGHVPPVPYGVGATYIVSSLAAVETIASSLLIAHTHGGIIRLSGPR